MRGSHYNELMSFVAVLEELNFRRAALRLGVTGSALSHTLRKLEDRLGVRLVNRSTRSVAPTDAGKALYNRVAPAMAELQGATEALNLYRAKPMGRVRLNMPRLAVQLVMEPMLADFCHAHPDIQLDLTVDDGLTDIVAGGFDAGIRPGQLLQHDMVAVRASADLRVAIVGSPAYFASVPVPSEPQDLNAHRCLAYRWVHSGATYRWPLAKDTHTVEFVPEGVLVVNDPHLLVKAALGGVGLACVLEELVAEDVAAGRLIRVLDDWCQPSPGFFLYYPSRRQMPMALRCFVDFLRERTSFASQR